MPTYTAEADTRDIEAEKRRKAEEDAAVMAVPISSDDEDAAGKATPPPSPPKKTASAANKKTAMENIKAIGANAGNTAPGRKSARKAMRVPRPGTYKAQQEGKAKQVADDEKENISQPVKTAEKRSLDGDNASDDEPKPIFGAIGYGNATKKPRMGNAISGYGNIHTRPPATYGSKRGVATYGGARKAAADNEAKEKKSPQDMVEGLLEDLKKSEVEEEAKKVAAQDSDDDLSDISMKLPPPPRSRAPAKGRTQPSPKKNKSSKPPREKPNAAACLQDLLALYANAPRPKSPLRVSELDPNASGTSTPLSSAPSHSEIDNPFADTDLTSDESSKCPICETPVEPAHLETFFADKPRRTVQQQQAFHREHELRSALEEYQKRAYPDINWAVLPERIAKQKDHLKKVLRGEVKSRFRDSQQETKFTDSPLTSPRKSKRQKGLSIIAHNTSLTAQSTGYYGPRGARAMLETITELLSTELRKAESQVPLIIEIGMVNFVLRVLVPECTVRLVVDDYSPKEGNGWDEDNGPGISEGVAVEIIRDSAEVGAVVWPEVGDTVEAVEEDESEDEE